MDLSQEEIIIAGVVIALIIFGYSKIKKDDSGRIKDESVRTSNVLEALSSFKAKRNAQLKVGYTEKSIQNQLKKHLQKRYVHVTDEYGIEGINATKIDFDLGNGKVGVELKLAKSLFKSANMHRLIGQVEEYQRSKYTKDNLIVVVFGEPTHTQERSHLKVIKERLEDKGVIYHYSEIPD